MSGKGDERRPALVPRDQVLQRFDALDWKNASTPTVLPPVCRACKCRPCEGSTDECAPVLTPSQFIEQVLGVEPAPHQKGIIDAVQSGFNDLR